MLTAIAQIIGGFLGGYLYASLLESHFHEKVNDAPKRTVERWKRHPWLLAPLIRTNFSHHTIHHVMTYRQDHVTQFRNAEEKARVDSLLGRSAHGIAVRNALYGATFSLLGWVAFCAPLVPGSILAYVLVGPAAAVGCLLATALPPFLSNTVHPYLHMSDAVAVQSAPWPLSLLLRTPYIRAVKRHHFVHHRHCRYNFNLLLGGDWIRGRVRRPNARDVAELERLGIRVD